jgi:hypothetical protein
MHSLAIEDLVAPNKKLKRKKMQYNLCGIRSIKCTVVNISCKSSFIRAKQERQNSISRSFVFHNEEKFNSPRIRHGLRVKKEFPPRVAPLLVKRNFSSMESPTVSTTVGHLDNCKTLTDLASAVLKISDPDLKVRNF